MSNSKYKYEGEIRYKSSTSEYCGLFSKRRKNASNGSVITDYYWILTNASGSFTNIRNNQLHNSFYDSKTQALNNIPSGFSNVTIAWENQKLLYYLNSFPLGNGSQSDIDTTKSEFLDAKNKGFDGVVIMIDWSVIFSSWSNQQNNIGNWAYDELVTYARDLGLKVAFRIWTCQTNLNVFGGSGGFYLSSGCQQDEWGNPIRIQGMNHVSLAYSTGLNMVYDYVGKVLARYSALLGNQMSFFSVVNTRQQENGLDYEGHQKADHSFGELFSANYDHSTHFLSYLQNTYLPANYATVADLNASWGTSYTSFSQATTPKTGAANGTASSEQINQTYRTNQGKDFWKANKELLDSFYASCRALGAANASQAKYILEFGAVADDLAVRRQSLNVEGANSQCDGIKAKMGAINSNDAFHNDILRVFDGKKGTELNPLTDRFQYGFTTVEESENGFFEIGSNAIRSGATLIVMMSGKLANLPYYEATMRIGARLRTVLDSFNQAVTNSNTMSYELGEAIVDINSVRQKWQNAGGGINTRIGVTQSENIQMNAGNACNVNFSPSTLGGLVYSDYGYFCLHENSIKSSVYRSGSQSLKNDYHINRFPIEGGTFSIDYLGSGAKTSYRVVGKNDGITWIRFVQTAVKTGGDSPNNHPVIADEITTGEDCTFWLPQTQDYEVIMENTGVGDVGFRVQTTYYGCPNFFDYQRKLPQGKTHKFVILKSRLDSRIEIYHKRLKINHNRNNESEGWDSSIDGFYRIEGNSFDTQA